MTTGRLIAVVGPSGVGKDSVMSALMAQEPSLGRIRRVITRTVALGEDCDCVTEAEFHRRQAAGDFALHWPAHGLLYGVPTSELAPLEQGRDLLVNLSRSVLAEAAERFPTLLVISLTARPEVLIERLSARGRESDEAVRGRVQRAKAVPVPAGSTVLTVPNDGPFDQTVAEIRSHLYPVRA